MKFLFASVILNHSNTLGGTFFLFTKILNSLMKTIVASLEKGLFHIGYVDSKTLLLSTKTISFPSDSNVQYFFHHFSCLPNVLDSTKFMCLKFNILPLEPIVKPEVVKNSFW